MSKQERDRDVPRLQVIDAVDVAALSQPWSFSIENKEKIAEFWAATKVSQPHFFNGIAHVMTKWNVCDAGGQRVLVGEMVRTDFASFLYWKRSSSKSGGYFDFSGGAAILTADDALLMVRTGEETLLPNILEFPSGLVDAEDFDSGGQMKFLSHVYREASEELALDLEQIGVPMKHLLSHRRSIVQAISVFRTMMSAAECIEVWQRRGARNKAEIANVIPIRRPAELSNFSVPAHVFAVVSYLLA